MNDACSPRRSRYRHRSSIGHGRRGNSAALSICCSPAKGRDACPRDAAPTPSRIEMSRQIIEPLALSRRYFRSRWALLRGLIRLFLPFRSEGQDQLTQERPLGFVCASTWLEGAPPERPPRFCGSALSWRRSQMRLDCHDCLSTGRVIDVAK